MEHRQQLMAVTMSHNTAYVYAHTELLLSKMECYKLRSQMMGLVCSWVMLPMANALAILTIPHALVEQITANQY